MLGLMTSLTSLNLRDNEIGDEGARILVNEVGFITSLTSLEL